MTSLIERLPSKDGILCRVWDDDITEAVICKVYKYSYSNLGYSVYDAWVKFAVPLNELELACYRQSKVYKAQMEKLSEMEDRWFERRATEVLQGE